MRKINLMISILGLLILACSSTSLFPTTPTPPPVVIPLSLPTETLPAAPSPMPTMAATQVPPTLTASATFIETATVAPTNTMTSTSTVQATSNSPTQPTPQGPVFQIVTLSGNQINWEPACAAHFVTITVQVANGFDVTSVLLFTRLLSRNQDHPYSLESCNNHAQRRTGNFYL